MIKALIFDFGGTLVDDLDFIYSINSEIIREYGKEPIPFEEYNKRFTSNWVEMYRYHGIIEEPEKLIEMFKKRSLDPEYLKKIKIYDRTIEFLSEVRKNYKLAINTSYRNDELQAIMKYVGMPNFFDIIVTHESVKTLKPNPESIYLIANRLKLTTEECAMFGDTVSDIECGNNAGAKTIAVKWGSNSIEDLQKAKPSFLAYCWTDALNYLKGEK